MRKRREPPAFQPDQAVSVTEKRLPSAETVLTPDPAAGRLAAETAVRSTTMQIFEGTNQIQRMVIARHLARG